MQVFRERFLKADYLSNSVKYVQNKMTKKNHHSLVLVATIDFATQMTTSVRIIDQSYLVNAERMEKRIKYCLRAAVYNSLSRRKGP